MGQQNGKQVCINPEIYKNDPKNSFHPDSDFNKHYGRKYLPTFENVAQSRKFKEKYANSKLNKAKIQKIQGQEFEVLEDQDMKEEEYQPQQYMQQQQFKQSQSNKTSMDSSRLKTCSTVKQEDISIEQYLNMGDQHIKMGNIKVSEGDIKIEPNALDSSTLRIIKEVSSEHDNPSSYQQKEQKPPSQIEELQQLQKSGLGDSKKSSNLSQGNNQLFGKMIFQLGNSNANDNNNQEQLQFSGNFNNSLAASDLKNQKQFYGSGLNNQGRGRSGSFQNDQELSQFQLENSHFSLGRSNYSDPERRSRFPSDNNLGSKLSYGNLSLEKSGNNNNNNSNNNNNQFLFGSNNYDQNNNTFNNSQNWKKNYNSGFQGSRFSNNSNMKMSFNNNSHMSIERLGSNLGLGLNSGLSNDNNYKSGLNIERSHGSIDQFIQKNQQKSNSGYYYNSNTKKKSKPIRIDDGSNKNSNVKEEDILGGFNAQNIDIKQEFATKLENSEPKLENALDFIQQQQYIDNQLQQQQQQQQLQSQLSQHDISRSTIGHRASTDTRGSDTQLSDMFKQFLNSNRTSMQSSNFQNSQFSQQNQSQQQQQSQQNPKYIFEGQGNLNMEDSSQRGFSSISGGTGGTYRQSSQQMNQFRNTTSYLKQINEEQETEESKQDSLPPSHTTSLSSNTGFVFQKSSMGTDSQGRSTGNMSMKSNLTQQQLSLLKQYNQNLTKQRNSNDTVQNNKSFTVTTENRTSTSTARESVVFKGCSCKQSQCLKMYCNCFRNNNVCGPLCSCKGCKNYQGSEEREVEIKKIMQNNEHAFQSKFEMIDKKKEKNPMANKRLFEQNTANQKQVFKTITAEEYIKIQKDEEQKKLDDSKLSSQISQKSKLSSYVKSCSNISNQAICPNNEIAISEMVQSGIENLKLEPEDPNQSSQIMSGSNVFTNHEQEQEQMQIKLEYQQFQQEKKKESKKQMVYKNGCTCKKTHCRKKYCECFNNGLKCSYRCMCINCYNMQEEQPDEEEMQRKKASLEQEEKLAMINKKKKLELEARKQQILEKRKQLGLVGVGIDDD